MTTTQPPASGWSHYPAALSAARSTLHAHPQLKTIVHRPDEEIILDLASHIWAKREKWDPARGAFPTWATRVAWGRLTDLARSSTTRKSTLCVTVAEMPDAPSPEKSKLSVAGKPLDLESRLAALVGCAKYESRISTPARNPKDRSPFAPSQLLAILVLQYDRKTSLRGVLVMLAGQRSLRDELDLGTQLPSVWALWRASRQTWGSVAAVSRLHQQITARMGEMEREE